MKKYITITVIVFIALLLILPFNGREKKLAETYMDMLTKKKAYVSFTTESQTQKTKIEQTVNLALDGDNMSIKMKMTLPGILPLPFETKIILKDKVLYIVDYLQKQVITFDTADHYSEIKENLKTLDKGILALSSKILKFTFSGKDNFQGEELYFEEYQSPVGKCKYFFKDKTLIGLSVQYSNTPEPLNIIINEFSETYPEEMFETPADFKEVIAEEGDFQFDMDNLFQP